MVSRQPYLLRAMYQWIEDNHWTPHIVVDVSVAGVDAPAGYASDGKLILNISSRACKDLEITNEFIRLETRFGGVSHPVHAPMTAVLAIYAQETGQGMLFEPELAGEDLKDAPRSPGKPDLKVIK